MAVDSFHKSSYIDTLRPLLDECAPLPFHEIEAVLEQELRWIATDNTTTIQYDETPCWKQTFIEIHPVPLGSASLAQVHKATLQDGTTVALKIQRPNLHKTVKADMLALSLLSKAVEWAFPKSGFDWML